jgi:hypothetical protein
LAVAAAVHATANGGGENCNSVVVAEGAASRIGMMIAATAQGLKLWLKLKGASPLVADVLTKGGAVPKACRH